MGMEIDVNRMNISIKQKKQLVLRLAKLLSIAKKDNKGDVFKINRVYLFHKTSLEVMEKQVRDKVAYEHKRVERQIQEKRENYAKEEEAAINRLRLEISNWRLEDEPRI